MFRLGNYGNALMAFEDARRQRRAMYERMERDLIELLSIGEVRRMGDSLDWVERYIQERNLTSAADILKELYYRIPRERFRNSVTAALTALGTLKDYPEAEIWIGQTYLVEGELTLALNQFQRAYAMRELLENSGAATELLYKIAAVRRTRQEYNEMERVLLSILTEDRLWSSGEVRDAPFRPPGTTRASTSFAREAMTRTLENDGINRFLTLYRYHNAESADAHRLLGFYYYSSGRHARAQEHLMFAFLIQNTIILEEIGRTRFDFSFTTLEDIEAEINRNRMLLEYMEKNEYYKTAYYLAVSLHGNGRTPAARSIWSFLATQQAAGEWRVRAASQLITPRVEQVVEMP